MQPSLRKKHRQIWMLLSPVISLMFLAVVFIRPQTFRQDKLPSKMHPAFSKLQSSQEDDRFAFHLKTMPNGAKQVEVALKEALQNPAANVYISTAAFENIASAKTLGRLGNHGIYRFNLSEAMANAEKIYLKIYDPIKEEELAAVQF